MTSYIGQRLDDGASLPGQLIKMPSAATGAFIRDNKPIGSNVAMALHNNASHLANDNVRHLAWWEGNTGLSQVSGWSGLRDGAAPDASQPADVEWEISWTRVVAKHFGPFMGIQDRLGTDGAPLLRRIVVEVDVAPTSIVLYAAIMAGFAPLPPYNGPLVISRTSPSSGINTISLDATSTLPAAEPIACRPAATTYGALAYPSWFWVWVGWKSASGADKIKSISVYEQRT